MNLKDKRLEFRSYVGGDFERASHLRKLFSYMGPATAKRSCDAEYYRWKILDNPVQPALFHVAEHNGNVVGMITGTPKRCVIKKKSTKGMEICDAYVHNDYQRQGIFSSLVNILREDALKNGGCEFLYTTPINDSSSLMGFEKKCSLSRIPSINVYSMVCPIQPAKIARTCLRASFIPERICNVLDRVAGFVYRKIYSVRPSAQCIADLRFSIAPSFSEDTYRLCDQLSANYDWIVERSRDYLDWRFTRNPDSYSICLAKYRGKTAGYAVFKLGTWQDLKVGYLVDFLTDEGNPEIFADMILYAFSFFQKAKVDMVSVWAVKDSHYYRTLKRFGFRLFKKVSLICYPNEIGKQVLNEPLKWHFTMADSDNI